MPTAGEYLYVPQPYVFVCFKNKGHSAPSGRDGPTCTDVNGAGCKDGVEEAQVSVVETSWFRTFQEIFLGVAIWEEAM